MHPYERLFVWQRAHVLAVTVYRLTTSCVDRTIRDQLRRGSQSIAANIVEGAGGQSSAQFARYLGIAISSACEVDYHLRFASDLALISEEDCQRLREEVIQIRRMLIGLLRRVRQAPSRPAATST